MARSLPDPRRPLLWLSLILLAGIAAVVVLRPDAGGQREPEAAAAKTTVRETVSAPAPAAAAQKRAVVAPPVDFTKAVPPRILPGHEGHGPECAACTAERGLAACREDYAQMEYARLLDELDADGPQAAKLLEECRRFAAELIKDWSPAKSRSELPADAVVAARRQEIIEPVLAGIPHKTSHD